MTYFTEAPLYERIAELERQLAEKQTLYHKAIENKKQFERDWLEACDSIDALKRQLAERDAMLAEFHKGIRKAEAFLDETDRRLPMSAREAAAAVTLRSLLASLPATAQANAKIIEAAEEQEYARRRSSHPHDNDYLSACSYTNEAVRAKRELKP